MSEDQRKGEINEQELERVSGGLGPMKTFLCPVCFDTTQASDAATEAGGPFCKKCLVRRNERVKMIEVSVVMD